jgi:glycosyltransferase involved in cell wall biosynthesis
MEKDFPIWKKKLKLLFLLTQDIESPSGLGRYFPLAKSLACLGHSVTIAALHPNYDGLRQKKILVDGVTVLYVAPMHVRKVGNDKLYYHPLRLLFVLLFATMQLIRTALFTQSDIIVVGKPHPMNGIAGLLGRFFRRAFLFVDCDDFEAGSGHFQGKLQKAMVAFFEKIIPRLANIVTTNTTFMQDNLQSWGVSAERIYYLPNGFDEQRFNVSVEDNTREKLILELNLKDRKVVSYIGSLSLVSHPVDFLIRAFPRVRHSVPDALLLIVGGGEDLVRLKKIVREVNLGTDAVYFSGRVSPQAAPLYYRLADVTVDPVYDNDAARGRCPLKLFESWASETPFVTCNVGDRSLLIGDPPAGLLTKPGDSEQLADAIISILKQPEKAAVLVKLGKNRVAAYSWDQLGQKFAEILDHVVQRSP